MKWKPFPWDKRTYKMGEEPHDEAAYQGGNIGPDVEVPEPVSTLGVQLYKAKVCIAQVIAWRAFADKIRLPIPPAPFKENTDLELAQAARAIDKALWHYDNNKLSDIGAQIIE